MSSVLKSSLSQSFVIELRKWKQEYSSNSTLGCKEEVLNTVKYAKISLVLSKKNINAKDV